MKCKFDQTGTLGTLYDLSVLIAVLAGSTFLSSFIELYDRFSAVMISAIVFAFFAAAAVVLHIIKGGVIYANSDKLVIVHSFAFWRVLVSRISYGDIEYADYNVKQKRSAILFYCYVYELYIHMKNRKEIKLCFDLNIPENRPMCDPDGYKRYISNLPMMKLCRYINERKG